MDTQSFKKITLFLSAGQTESIKLYFLLNRKVSFFATSKSEILEVLQLSEVFMYRNVHLQKKNEYSQRPKLESILVVKYIGL